MKRYEERDAKKVAEYLKPVQNLAFSGFFVMIFRQTRKR
jgi:hypothetical protein